MKSANQKQGSMLGRLLAGISDKCTDCGVCQLECAFLQKYGTPKDIAGEYDSQVDRQLALSFECSLCGLCAAVCPAGLNPPDLFLELRREKMRRDPADYAEHNGLLSYERLGTSRRFTYYGIPAGGDAVFFPGCALPGSRPDKTVYLYKILKKSIPGLGIVLDCCMKISHDLGREDCFQTMFGEMKSFLSESGIRRVIVACPNCYKVFSMYGGEIAVETVYEVLAESVPVIRQNETDMVLMIHDPCAVRFDNAVHDSIRKLAAHQGWQCIEMDHRGETTFCCGAGGSVSCLAPDLAGNWGEKRKSEAGGIRMVTYCGGCTNQLNKLSPTSHIVDLLKDPSEPYFAPAKVSTGPMTYLNRLLVKRRLKKTVDAAITRERVFRPGEENKKGIIAKRIFIICLIISAIAAVRFSGAADYLEQEKLRQLIAGFGMMAPIVYMLIYSVAPALLLPGLPITIVGGILFGPFWGVVYTITSATIGACIAFLVARYVARDWVEKKLRGPRWRRLDRAVEDNGWKVVAFTRLIPLFPFNLLNYAFGLTKIRFLHYALATFVFMLPACIAFIVFSSSLLDLVRGHVSVNFAMGLALIAVVALIPVAYRRYKAKKKISDLV